MYPKSNIYVGVWIFLTVSRWRPYVLPITTKIEFGQLEAGALSW